MKRDRVTNVLLALIALLMCVYLYIKLEERGVIELKINSAVQESVAEQFAAIKIPEPIAGKDGYTPVKGIDYFDGKDGQNATNEQVQTAVNNYFTANPVKNGTDGSNGKDAPLPEKGVDYFDGLDGKTPVIRCNENKNRWEVKYGEEGAWQLLNNQHVKCTIGD